MILKKIRCAFGFVAAMLCAMLTVLALAPSMDVVLCKCNENDIADATDTMCASFNASLFDLAQQGDGVMLSVYWLLIITFVAMLIRIAGTIAFFHTEEAKRFFIVDSLANLTTCLMTSVSFSLITSWASHEDQCSIISIRDKPFSCLPLLCTSIVISAAVSIIDGTVLMERPRIYSLVPTTQMDFVPNTLSSSLHTADGAHASHVKSPACGKL